MCEECGIEHSEDNDKLSIKEFKAKDFHFKDKKGKIYTCVGFLNEGEYTITFTERELINMLKDMGIKLIKKRAEKSDSDERRVRCQI